MGHADAVPHHQALDLVKHGGMGQVRVAAVDLAGGHHGHGRLAGKHGAHLHRRGVGAHEHLFSDVEGVLHVPGRMLGGHVQGLEIVVVDFHFRARGHVKAEALENAADLLHDQRGGMQGAAPGRAARQGGIETRQGLGFAPGFQSAFARLEQGVAAFLDAVGGLSHGRTLSGLELGQPAHDLGETPLAAQKIHPQAFQVFQ